MILSEKKRFLFIHIPKNGGTALNLALAPYGRLVEYISYTGSATKGVSRLLSLTTGGNPVLKLTGMSAHASLSSIKHRFGADKIDPLYKFAIVRNPYSRAFSLYSHCKRIPSDPDHNLANMEDFAGFISHLLAGPNAIRLLQRRFVLNGDMKTSGVNSLLAFERIGEDILILEKALDLPKPLKLRSVNVNPTPPANLIAECQSVAGDLAAFLAEDFDMFGYSKAIEDFNEPPQNILVGPYSSSKKRKIILP